MDSQAPAQPDPKAFHRDWLRQYDEDRARICSGALLLLRRLRADHRDDPFVAAHWDQINQLLREDDRLTQELIDPSRRALRSAVMKIAP